MFFSKLLKSNKNSMLYRVIGFGIYLSLSLTIGCQSTQSKSHLESTVGFSPKTLECKISSDDLIGKKMTWNTESDYRLRTTDLRHGYQYNLKVTFHSEQEAEATVYQKIGNRKVQGISSLEGRLSKTGKTMQFVHRVSMNSTGENHRLLRFQITPKNRVLRLEHQYARNFEKSGLYPHDGHFIKQESGVTCAESE